jgi:hypothetical protein
VTRREIFCYVWRGKLDDNLLASRFGIISQALRFFNAVCRFAVADIGKEESRDDFRGEKESNMDTILEGNSEEGMRLDLDGIHKLDLGNHPKRLEKSDRPV